MIVIVITPDHVTIILIESLKVDALGKLVARLHKLDTQVPDNFKYTILKRNCSKNWWTETWEQGIEKDRVAALKIAILSGSGQSRLESEELT